MSCREPAPAPFAVGDGRMLISDLQRGSNVGRSFDDWMPGSRVEDNDDRADPAARYAEVLCGALRTGGQRGVEVVDERRLALAIQLTDQIDARNEGDKAGEGSDVLLWGIERHHRAAEVERIGQLCACRLHVASAIRVVVGPNDLACLHFVHRTGTSVAPNRSGLLRIRLAIRCSEPGMAF